MKITHKNKDHVDLDKVFIEYFTKLERNLKIHNECEYLLFKLKEAIMNKKGIELRSKNYSASGLPIQDTNVSAEIVELNDKINVFKQRYAELMDELMGQK